MSYNSYFLINNNKSDSVISISIKSVLCSLIFLLTILLLPDYDRNQIH